MEKVSDEAACIIVEPIAGNMGCIPPLPGYLETLKTLCEKHGTVLIFDEVMTGFRVAREHYPLYDVAQDLLRSKLGGGLL